MSPQPGAAPASLVQPIVAGLLAAMVGFASSFTVVLAGFSAAGASAAQSASGLMTLCLVQGGLAIALSLWWRLPISIVWSTPGFALLIATGTPQGGFATAVGAFAIAAALMVLAGLWRPFGRLVERIPAGLANAMLAGVLFEICLAPVEAAKATPGLILPVVLVWAVALRVARRYAVPIAVAATALIIVFGTHLPPGALAASWPAFVVTPPAFRWDVAGSLAVPLFIVTMASQNIPGLAVLRANGYRPPLAPIFVVTGLGSLFGAAGGGGPVNLAAITAALCAGPDAHPDPARRWVSSVAAGALYIVLGLFAAVTTAFIHASPPAMVQSVAGLALMGTLGGALAAALARERDRIAVAVTFVTTASGISVFGIGASFWGLVAGGLLMLVDWRPAPADVPAASADQEAGRLAARK